MMRIIATTGAVNVLSRAQDRAVDVDRQGAGAQRLDFMGNNVDVEGFRGLLALVGIPFQKTQMMQPPAAHHQQPQDDPAQTRHTEIAAGHHTTQMKPQLLVPFHASQITHQKFQSRMRREAFTREFDLQFVVDTTPQIRSLSSHGRWPFVLGQLGVLSLPNIPSQEAFSY